MSVTEESMLRITRLSCALESTKAILFLQYFAYRSNSERNFCRQEHLQFHCLPICTIESPSY
jgi:hypothetical protein